MVHGLTLGEDVEADLSADGVCHLEVGELFLDGFDHGGPDVVFLYAVLSMMQPVEGHG